jgi:membrane-bound lytic murein transglycosylase D
MNKKIRTLLIISALFIGIALIFLLPSKKEPQINSVEPAAHLPEPVIAEFSTEPAPEEEAAVEDAMLPVPEGLEKRVKLWEAVYGEYDRSRLVIYHRGRPGIIYEAIYDQAGRKKRVIAMTRSRLLTLDRITRYSDDPLAEISKREDGPELFELYRKFDSPPEADRFRKAAKQGMIGALRGRRSELVEGYRRAAPYLPAMERIFEERGIPRKITRLVFVESMFDRKAESSKGAAGVWQFMPSTAKGRLVMTRGIDERRDPIAGTRAAARILHYDYLRLGTWPLAVTAYNAGTGRIQDAVKQTGSDSLPVIIEQYDHRSMGFAVENFYARLVAIIRVEERLELTSKTTNTGPDPLEYDLVPLPGYYALHKLAKKLGMNRGMLVHLNPAWTEAVEESRTKIPKGYLLRVPKGSEGLVRATLGLPPPPEKTPLEKPGAGPGLEENLASIPQ